MGIVLIRLEIRTRRLRMRLYANFGKFGCIISLKNNKLACFFGHPLCQFSHRPMLSKLKILPRLEKDRSVLSHLTWKRDI